MVDLCGDSHQSASPNEPDRTDPAAMLSGWWRRQNLGPLRRRSFLSPTRVLTCEETPQTSQRPSFVCGAGGESCADALDFVVAMKLSLRGPGPGEWQLPRGHLFIRRPTFYYNLLDITTACR
jgi:hypothetical protein